jgi:hypothetical protein
MLFYFEKMAPSKQDIISNSLYVLFSAQGYSVVLPEKLQTGKWNVYR